MLSTRPSCLARLLAVAAVAALTIAACGSSGPAASPGAPEGPELTHITVGTLAITDAAPLFIAINKGYFKRQGLTVTTKIVTQSTAALPDMISGSVSIIGSGNYVSFFQAEAKGVVKVRILAASSQCAGNTQNVLVMPSSKITSPAGLAGQTIAVNLPGNIQTLTIDAVLRAHGINPARVTFVEIPFPDMIPALTSGRVKAISEVEPFITAAQDAGARSVLAQCQGSTAGIPLSGYYATQAWVQKYPRTALAFQRAIELAQATADADPALVRQVIPTYTTIKPAVAARISLPYYPPTLNAAQLSRVVSLMRSAGQVSSSFSVTPMLYHPGAS